MNYLDYLQSINEITDTIINILAGEAYANNIKEECYGIKESAFLTIMPRNIDKELINDLKEYNEIHRQIFNEFMEELMAGNIKDKMPLTQINSVLKRLKDKPKFTWNNVIRISKQYIFLEEIRQIKRTR